MINENELDEEFFAGDFSTLPSSFGFSTGDAFSLDPDQMPRGMDPQQLQLQPGHQQAMEFPGLEMEVSSPPAKRPAEVQRLEASTDDGSAARRLELQQQPLGVPRESQGGLFASLKEIEGALESAPLDGRGALAEVLLDECDGRLTEMVRQLELQDREEILFPAMVAQALSARDYAEYLRKHVEVERAVLRGEEQVCIAARRQPFPCLFMKKHSMIAGSWELALVCPRALREHVEALGAECEVSLLLDPTEVQRKRENNKPIPPDDQLLGSRTTTWQRAPDGRLVAHPGVLFDFGSMGKVCHLTLRSRVAVRGHVLALESPRSRGFIILTHHSRWAVGMKEMLRYLLFDRRVASGAPLPAVLSAVQWAFGLAFQGAPDARVLGEGEKAFIATHLAASPSATTLVSPAQWKEFWLSFGHVVRSIRFMQPVTSMWREGKLWALCSRAQAEAALRGCPSGSFLVRFTLSPAHAERKFVVVYVKNGRILHYLLKQTDVNNRTSLPQFLLDQPTLTHLLVLNVAAVSDGIPCTVADPDTTSLVDKRVALSAFANSSSSHDDVPAEDGYVESFEDFNS